MQISELIHALSLCLAQNIFAAEGKMTDDTQLLRHKAKVLFQNTAQKGNK